MLLTRFLTDVIRWLTLIDLLRTCIELQLLQALEGF